MSPRWDMRPCSRAETCWRSTPRPSSAAPGRRWCWSGRWALIPGCASAGTSCGSWPSQLLGRPCSSSQRRLPAWPQAAAPWVLTCSWPYAAASRAMRQAWPCSPRSCSCWAGACRRHWPTVRSRPRSRAACAPPCGPGLPSACWPQRPQARLLRSGWLTAGSGRPASTTPPCPGSPWYGPACATGSSVRRSRSSRRTS